MLNAKALGLSPFCCLVRKVSHSQVVTRALWHCWPWLGLFIKLKDMSTSDGTGPSLPSLPRCRERPQCAQVYVCAKNPTLCDAWQPCVCAGGARAGRKGSNAPPITVKANPHHEEDKNRMSPPHLSLCHSHLDRCAAWPKKGLYCSHVQRGRQGPGSTPQGQSPGRAGTWQTHVAPPPAHPGLNTTAGSTGSPERSSAFTCRWGRLLGLSQRTGSSAESPTAPLPAHLAASTQGPGRGAPAA